MKFFEWALLLICMFTTQSYNIHSFIQFIYLFIHYNSPRLISFLKANGSYIFIGCFVVRVFLVLFAFSWTKRVNEEIIEFLNKMLGRRHKPKIGTNWTKITLSFGLLFQRYYVNSRTIPFICSILTILSLKLNDRKKF